MKKRMTIVCALALAICMGCLATPKKQAEETPLPAQGQLTPQYDDWRLEEYGKHYVVLEAYDAAGVDVTLIMNSDYEVVYHVTSLKSFVYELEDGILEIEEGHGTGATKYLFYDPTSDRFSEIYPNYVVAAGHGLVAYVDWVWETDLRYSPIELVVQDIFDESAFYCSLELPILEGATWASDNVKAKFLDENTLEITYLSLEPWTREEIWERELWGQLEEVTQVIRFR